MTARSSARRACGALAATILAAATLTTATALAVGVPAASAAVSGTAADRAAVTTVQQTTQPLPLVPATGQAAPSAKPSAGRTSAAPTATSLTSPPAAIATHTPRSVRTSPPVTVRRTTQAPQSAATDLLDNGPTGVVPTTTFDVGQVAEQSLADVSETPAPSLSAVAAGGSGAGDSIRLYLIIALCVSALLFTAGVGGVVATRTPDLAGDAADYSDRPDRGGRHRRRR
jgi:hypothetical protein